MATNEISSSDAVLLPSAAATSETVVVKFGTEGRKYTLHTALLKHHSGYFRGALSGAFKETDDGIISLLDADIDAFDLFVDWMYTGVVGPITPNPKLINGIGPKIRSYILADRLLAPKLKSAVLDVIFTSFRENIARHTCCKAVTYTFTNLSENDPMLRFIVDTWCIRDSVKYMTEE